MSPTTHHGFLLVSGLSIAALFGAGCTSNGTRPEDMSASDHEAAASGEEAIAEEHERQYDPAAAELVERCGTGGRRPCWTSSRNPTREHLEMASHHRSLARQHREASMTLQLAEQESCSRLHPDDRDISPLAHWEDIRSIEPLMRTLPAINVDEPVEEALVGATVNMRALQGLTGEWLQAVVSCHIARNAVTGGTGMEYCPLAVPGVTAEVRSTRDGFAVDIRAQTASDAAEVLRRSQRLTSEPAMGESVAP